MAYWVEFDEGPPGCIEHKWDEPTDLETATPVITEIAERETARKVKRVRALPYPANPRLVKVLYEHNGKEYHSPSFCYTPRECAGHGCCPKSYSCTN